MTEPELPKWVQEKVHGDFQRALELLAAISRTDAERLLELLRAERDVMGLVLALASLAHYFRPTWPDVPDDTFIWDHLASQWYAAGLQERGQL
ncbi:hypothetical protein [Micropruina sp.]|uniref:hypothetical protein n=1 Tax=Micropruina sp. TaxID=2737536 RepID=UPI0039E40147